MNKKAVKKVRWLLLNKTPEILLILRSNFGERTKEMETRQIYQNTKKLYKQGKLNELLKGEMNVNSRTKRR